MAGLAGFEPTMTESKSVALPLGYSPIYSVHIKLCMGRLKGVEPSNAGATIRCVNRFATTAIYAQILLYMKIFSCKEKNIEKLT